MRSPAAVMYYVQVWSTETQKKHPYCNATKSKYYANEKAAKSSVKHLKAQGWNVTLWMTTCHWSEI